MDGCIPRYARIVDGWCRSDMNRQKMTAGPGKRSSRDDLAEIILRGRLLLSSYAPLGAILSARTTGEARYTFAALAIAGLLDASRLTWLAGRLSTVPRSFAEVRDAGSEVAGYLATYLLPFLAAPHASVGDLVGYSIYAAVVIVITVRSNLGVVNPTIYLLGWRVALVRVHGGRERFLICRHIPPASAVVNVADFFGVLRTSD